MNHYIGASGDRKPASDEMLVWLVILPASCLEGLCHTITKAGLTDALKKAGAKEGSTVKIGEIEFDFFE